MALKFSTGFKNKLLDGTAGPPAGGALKDMFDDGVIEIFSGTPPASPDDAITGTLIVTYTDNGAAEAAGTGLDLAASASGGAISKASAQTWKGNAVASLTGTHFRYRQQGDINDASTTDIRIQGTVGGAGADLFVSSTSFTSGLDYTIDLFSIAIPDL